LLSGASFVAASAEIGSDLGASPADSSMRLSAYKD
jgi:hypothetical protein